MKPDLMYCCRLFSHHQPHLSSITPSFHPSSASICTCWSPLLPPPSSIAPFTSHKAPRPPTSSRRGAFSVFQKVWLSRHLSRGVGTVTPCVCVCVSPHMPALCSDVSSSLRLKINYIFSWFAFIKWCFGEGSSADAHRHLIGRDDPNTRINRSGKLDT